MNFGELLLRSTLGASRAPDKLTLALFAGSREIKDAAYRRAEIPKGSWRIGHTREGHPIAEAVCRFGPFLEVTGFDRVCLMRGDEIIDEESFDTPVSAPMQTVYEHTYVQELYKTRV